mmetsp:Transcript_20847/g.62400  ORF Transcript_20847/g.62400 Transcript_20847/m.62400 type:complete len:216 (+) Transcript_20847:538-1185(+)
MPTVEGLLAAKCNRPLVGSAPEDGAWAAATPCVPVTCPATESTSPCRPMPSPASSDVFSKDASVSERDLLGGGSVSPTSSPCCSAIPATSAKLGPSSPPAGAKRAAEGDANQNSTVQLPSECILSVTTIRGSISPSAANAHMRVFLQAGTRGASRGERTNFTFSRRFDSLRLKATRAVLPRLTCSVSQRSLAAATIARYGGGKAGKRAGGAGAPG